MPGYLTPSTTLVVVSIALITRYLLKRKVVNYPPGPKPRFLIGNALDFPTLGPSRKFLEWSKELNSSLVHLDIPGTRILVLHSLEDAEELLERRGAYYSDRPIIPTMDIIGWDYNYGLFPYDDFWRTHRRISQQHFKASSVHKYYPIQIRKTHDMLIGLLDTPDRFDDHNKMLSISIPLTTMYGYEVTSLDDPVIVAADMNVELGARLISPGGSFANIIPILKYVPWTWTQRMAKEIRHLVAEMKRIPLEAVLKDVENGTAIPSLVGDFFQGKRSAQSGVARKQNKNGKKQKADAIPEDEQIMLNIANTVYSAGSDTTISATRTFFYLLAKHPRVQAKAQAELDQVLGSPPRRLPTFSDAPSLPYIEAIYREVLRWYPPVYLGVPHVSTEDDWYNGYFIPRGTTIFANIWAMNRDEKIFGPNPYAFNPDRFFDENGELKDIRVLSYGFGRRGCVGKHLARNTLFLMMASVLACFNLGKKKDKNGDEIPIDDSYHEEGIIGRKNPFEIGITPRSDAWRNLIDATRNQGYQF